MPDFWGEMVGTRARARDNVAWPRRTDPCFYCGSDIPGHHTLLCEFVWPGDVLDLPMLPGGSQHWNFVKP